MKDRQSFRCSHAPVARPSPTARRAVATVSAFSLAEVVVALGVVSFAIVAILGVLPVGLQTGKSSQDETRATQIAQMVLSAMVSQSQSDFTGIKLPVTAATSVDLSSSQTVQLFANNDGVLSDSPTDATYNVAIICDSNVTPAFDSGYANKVTVQVRWPVDPNPSQTPKPSQNYRDYVRIISKY